MTADALIVTVAFSVLVQSFVPVFILSKIHWFIVDKHRILVRVAEACPGKTGCEVETHPG